MMGMIEGENRRRGGEKPERVGRYDKQATRSGKWNTERGTERKRHQVDLPVTLSQDVNQGAGRGAATQMGLHADGAAAPRCAFCVSAHTCV